MAEKKKAILKILIAFFCVPTFWTLISTLGWLKPIDNWLMDLRFWIRGEINAPVKTDTSVNGQKSNLNLIYVDVDNSSVAMMGEEPVPLSYYAQAFYALAYYGKARVISSDIMFSDKQHSSLADMQKISQDEDIFRQVVTHIPNLILGSWYNAYGNISDEFTRNDVPLPLFYKGFNNTGKNKPPITPPERFGGKSVSLGLINTDPFMNGGKKVRWIPLYTRIDKKVYLTLALEIARLYYGIYPDAVKIYGDDNAAEQLEGIFKIIFIGMNGKFLMDIPLVKRQLLEINWFTSWDSGKDKHISFSEVIKQKQQLEGGKPSEVEVAQNFFEKFKDAIVLVGQTHETSRTLIETPVDDHPVPSISAHSNLLKTLFSGRFIQRLPWYSEWLVVFALTFLAASLTLYSEVFGRVTRIFIALIITYICLSFGCFGLFNADVHLALPLVSVLCSMLTIIFFGIVYQLIVERKQRIRIKGIFGTYLSPEVVAAMVEEHAEPQLGGVEKHITAFFSDIQNFSSFSEVLSPSLLVSLMNEYLTAMTEILKEEGGTLDKFIGDAIVAMFGAPLALEGHPLRSCVAACRIQQKQAWLRDKWKKEAEKWPKDILRMRTRIGLNSGSAIVGNMGSSTRFNYTMMGDTVNLGARCESAAKTYGVYSLVTEDTYKPAIAENNEVVFRFVDRIVVKGRKQPIGIYEIVGLRKELPDSAFECIDYFEKGIQRYLAQDWDGALGLFERSTNLEPLKPGREVGVTLNPSLLFLKRCQYMKENPPEKDWDGVFIMKTK